MAHKEHGVFDARQSSEFAVVYYYLLAGIALVVSAYVFLPRVSMG